MAMTNWYSTDPSRLAMLRPGGQSLFLLSPFSERLFICDGWSSLPSIQRLESPTKPHLAESQSLVTKAAPLLLVIPKQQCYKSLLKYHAPLEDVDPKGLITELNDFILDTLRFDDKPNGKRGLPPLMSKKLLKLHPFERWGGRIKH